VSIAQFPKGKYGAEFVGPFAADYRVVAGGYAVPHLTMFRSDEKVCLVLDHRFGTEDVSEEEAQRWIPFIAHAMAVAAGYSCHGENCTPVNPYKVQMTGLDALPTK
jgi:hypothetical protein